jgi:hypothetical protein
MTYWIKRIAGMLSFGSFFIGFFMSIDPSNPFDAGALAIACFKGGAGALMFWAAGFVMADIVVKGLVTDLHTEQKDVVEGGLLQRIFVVQSARTPEFEGVEGDATLRIQAMKSVEKQKTAKV